MIFCIDDYHNIHTKHRPETKTQTQAVHMTTLLLEVFPNIKAVPKSEINLLPVHPVEINRLKVFTSDNVHHVLKTYAESMPDWIVAKYFDAEAERQRLLIHDYQQTEIQPMRSMDNTKLVDSIELPLKSSENVLTAVEKILSGVLEIYSPSLPAVLKNIIPLIGPLHISLNARECVLLMFHPIFADLYASLFGKKPWRISLLLEVIYGGWTLVRDMILSVFGKCKDVEFLTLVNLVDNCPTGLEHLLHCVQVQ